MAFDPVKPEVLELNRFKNSEGRAFYSQALPLLIRSGLISLLRTFARPYAVDNGANPYVAAYQAAFSNGYNQALDDILYFEEMYLQENLGKKEIKATFGALGIAMAKGDLTAKDIKNGK